MITFLPWWNSLLRSILFFSFCLSNHVFSVSFINSILLVMSRLPLFLICVSSIVCPSLGVSLLFSTSHMFVVMSTSFTDLSICSNSSSVPPLFHMDVTFCIFSFICVIHEINTFWGFWTNNYSTIV